MRQTKWRAGNADERQRAAFRLANGSVTRTSPRLDLRQECRPAVAYGLDAVATSRPIGCYTGIHDDIPHVQPAAFVVDGSGTILHAVYSSGKVGRLTAEDALMLIRDQQKKREGRR